MATATNVEAPNDLNSTGIYKATDGLCEGPIKGFVVKSGVEGTNPLVSTYFNNVPVLNPDGSSNFNTSGQGFFFGYTLGTSGQSVPPNFGKVETFIPLSSNHLSFPPDGAGEKKDVVCSFNTDQYPDADSVRITFRIPSLATTDENGNTNGYNISAKVEFSLNGGPFVVPSQYGGYSTITGKCTSPYLYDVVMTLPKTTPPNSRYEWKIRVSRATRNILSIRTQNEIYVEAISVISTNSFTYRNTALTFVEISADQFPTIPARAYEIDGLLLKVPSGYTPTIYNVNGTITPATYPTVWDGTWSSGGGELLRNGDFTQPLAADWAFGTNVSAQTTETSSPPPGQAQYLKVVAKNSPSDWVIDPYQPSFSASIISGKKYHVSGWYKMSSVEGALEIRVKSDDVSFELTAQTDWTYFEQDIVAGSGNWLSWRWIVGRGTLTSDILYLAALSVTDVDSGKVWTNNPAWIFYDLLTNKRYGLGKYIQESLLDKWTLYKIAQYCDEMVDDGKGGLEPRFTCNVAVQTRKDAYQLLQNFVSVFQGMIYWASDRIMTSQVRDTKEIQLFTNANVIDGKFSYSDTAKNTRSTVVKVKWMNPENFYKETVEIVEDIDGIARYGYTEKEITAFACTSKGQAVRAANWVLLTERYMTETITFQAGMEGIYTAPGEIFSVYDNFRKNSMQGGRVVRFNAGRDSVTLDRQIFLRPGYTYQLSATVPKESYDIESVTGSDQIDFIQNSQVETRNVTSNTGYNTLLSVDSGFSAGLYNGSIWQLSAIGTDNVLSFAQKYRCLATSEPSKGIVEVLGVEWNTGIPYRVDTNYNVLPNPTNSGDQAGVLPPSNLVISTVTGDYLDNTVFRYLNLSWTHSPSTNRAAYEISGQMVPSGWQLLKIAPDNTFNYNVFNSGQYNFSIRTVSEGGVFSTPLMGGYNVAKNNPFGAPPQLASAFVETDADTRLGAGGYFGNTVTVNWTIPTGRFGLDVPESNYIAGYRFHALNPTNNADLMTPVTISGAANTTYSLSWNQINGFIGGARRDIKAYVETFDTDNVFRSGASIILNNPACAAANGASFFGVTGSLNYTINENDFDVPDTSGVMFWYNASNGFTPTFSNVQYQSKRLSGLINTSLTGQYYAWYSLIDTFGASGSNIIGPITVTGNLSTGPKGDYIERRYNQSMTVPSTPTGDNPAGWTVTTLNPVNGPIWYSEATKDSNGHVVGVWTTPQRLSGNIIFFQNTAPTGTALLTGDTWFDTGNGNKIYRWDGANWVSAQRVLDTTDFGTGVKPVQYVGALPAGVEGDLAFLTTDGQLYRYHSGAWTLAVPAVNVTGQLSDSQLAAIAAAKLTGTIVGTQIADGAITTAKIFAGSVTTNEIAANTITAGDIAANTITAGQIAANTITATQIAANTITASQIAANTITAGQIAAATITATLIGANEVIAQTANIKDSVITDAKIANLAAGKITAGTISSQAIIIAGGTSGLIRSDNYSAGTTGWKIDGSGAVEFNSGKMSGFTVNSSSMSAVGSLGSLDISSSLGSITATNGTIKSSFFASDPGTGGVAGITVSSTGGDAYAKLQNSGLRGVLTLYASNVITAVLDGGSSAPSLTFSTDTNLYRSAANTLKTDDSLHVLGDVVIGPSTSSKLYFYGNTEPEYIDQDFGIRVHGDNTHPFKLIGCSLQFNTTVSALGGKSLSGYIPVLDSNGNTVYLAIVS